MALVFGLHSTRESTYESKALSSLFDGGGLLCPGQRSSGTDDFVASLLGEPSKVPEKAFLQAERKSEFTVEFDVAGNVVTQHGAPSGHGCATFARRSTSTLA